MTPEIHYTSSGDVNIAYQVIGDGPQDHVIISGWISNLEVYWECPEYVRFVEYLARFSRVILFDKRGTGLSDRVSDLPSLEVRMDDVRAVLDAVGSTSASLFGWSEGARFRNWWARLLSMSASANDAARLFRMNAQIDVRPILQAIRVPTLVIHSRKDPAFPIDGARNMASQIPDAQLMELDDADHVPFVRGSESVLQAIESFMTGNHGSASVDRVLATVMFTDIVDSTKTLSTIGDSAWRQLISAHHEVVRKELSLYRGQEIDTTGDGYLASFDGPARAIRCARAIVANLKSIGLEIRAGIHTGECEIVDGQPGGIAVHIGARLSDLAQSGEVLVSGTVRDLVAGSGLQFEEKGIRELKGVQGQWPVFLVD